MNFANEKCEFAENIRRIHGNLRIDSSVEGDHNMLNEKHVTLFSLKENTT